MLTKAQYVEKKKKELDDWSAEMDVLEAKVQKAKAELKSNYREQLDALRARRRDGQKRLDSIKAAAGDSWENLKAETENVWKAIEDSVRTFKTHFVS